jgi:hypothetical protein
VESEYSQHPREPREIAVDDAHQIGHPALSPVIEGLPSQEAHGDQHIDGRDDRAAPQNILGRVNVKQLVGNGFRAPASSLW